MLLESSREEALRGRKQNKYRYGVEGKWRDRRARSRRPRRQVQRPDDKARIAKSPEALGVFAREVGVPLRLIHVVRNPFDIVARIAKQKIKDGTGRGAARAGNRLHRPPRRHQRRGDRQRRLPRADRAPGVVDRRSAGGAGRDVRVPRRRGAEQLTSKPATRSSSEAAPDPWPARMVGRAGRRGPAGDRRPLVLQRVRLHGLLIPRVFHRIWVGPADAGGVRRLRADVAGAARRLGAEALDRGQPSRRPAPHGGLRKAAGAGRAREHPAARAPLAGGRRVHRH